MKIEFEISDLEFFIKAFNNSLVVFADIVSAMKFGCEPVLRQKVASQLELIPDEERERRFQELWNVYVQLEKMEKLLKVENLLDKN